MRVNYNISSIIAKNALANNDNRLSLSVQKLSSGYKINSAKENAAGLAIARKMHAQINSLKRANDNANDGLSIVSIADGAMSEMHEILQRMNELAIQSANGVNSDTDREQIQKEIDQLVTEIDRIAETTQYNAQNLLDGTFAYKGYTNSENVRLKSYSDGVKNGTYLIDQLEYSYYDEEITYESGGTVHKERYGVDNIDEVKDGIVKESDIKKAKSGTYDDSVEGFPDDVRVSVDGDDLVFEAGGDFEVKISLNTATVAYQNSGLPVNYNPADPDKDVNAPKQTHTETKRYREIPITIKNSDGSVTTCTISDISIFNEYEMDVVDENGNLRPGAAPINDKENVVRAGNGNASFDSLKEGLSTVLPQNVDHITTVTYSSGSFTVVYTVKPDGKEEKINLPVSEEILDGSKYSTTKATKTTYTIGRETKLDTNGGPIDENGNPIDKETVMKNSIQLNLTGTGAMRIQVGANQGQVIAIEIPALSAVHLGIDGFDVTTENAATEAIDIVGKAINQLSGVRAKIGAYANRLEHTIANLDTTEEDMTEAYSRIMDVDMATEMTEYTTSQVLSQASTSMLAQANERPQQVLQLLQ